MKFFKKAYVKPSVIALMWLFTNLTQSNATDYTVSSADDFNDLSLSAGDVVTWTDGNYSDQEIVFTGSGTASNPIILTAETPGGVTFTGSSEVNISGSYLIIEGFLWNGGEGTSDHIEFRKSGSSTEFANNCTIRNCGFDNLFTTEPDKSRWIVMHGTNNVVENCSFVNKLSAGACILVELSYAGSSTPGHTIRNNYFYNITAKDDFSTNSGDCEAIRIGVSSYQSVSAQVLVEGNYFQAADGENEIITNKSADNTFLHNTFRNCRGSLVLRHGAGAHIEGNFFLGEGKAKSGGIRVSDRDHVIVNNYMQNLSNDGDVWNNGITLVGGGESSGGSGNGYQNVDNILVAFNTIYNSDAPIHYNDRNSYDPTGTIAYNLVYSTNGDIVSGDIAGTGGGMTYVGNIFGGSTVGISDAGITEGNANFSASGEIYKPSSTGIAANAAGSTYASVDLDIEGLTRPNNNMDVGAHEVSGASGTSIYAPITDSDVGGGVGACFIDATGAASSCSTGGNSLSLSSLADFTSGSGNNTLSVSSNVSWSASDNANWLSLSPTSGSNNGSITVTVSANSSSSDRTGIITVTGGSLTRTVTVTQLGVVQNVNVTGVNLSSSSSTIAVGSTQQLSASVTPTNATNQGVSYSSSNTSVATVSANGLVTAISQGSTTITVTTTEGGFTDTSSIDVLEVSGGTNLALNKTVTGTGTADGANVPANLVDNDPTGASRWSVSGFPQSATIDLGIEYSLESTEIVCYSDRAYKYVTEVSSSSSGPFTEIVDRTGNTTQGTASSPIIDVFSPVNARYVRVTVSGADSYTGSWVSLTEVRVFGESIDNTVPVTGVSLTQSSASLTVGDTQQMSVVVSPSNASNPNVSYSSNNSSVASVDTNGLVTAQGTGTATITVTTVDGTFTDTSLITVSSVGGTLPAPWQTTDVGAVGETGSASYTNGTFTILGAGADIWGAADEFRFVYQTLNGDGEITAQVNSLTNTNAWSKAGVMIRETLDAGSKHAISVVTPSRGVSFQRRLTTNGNSSHTTISGQTVAEWLRLNRTGDLITAYHSDDGSSWTQIGSVTISMSSSVFIGLCMTSHVDATLGTADISDVTITSGPTENTVTNGPIADTYIRGGDSADVSYASDTELWLKETSGDSYKRRVFLKFSLANVSGTVSSAVLQMTPTLLGSTSSAVTSQVYHADDWSNDLVWNDNPVVNTFLDSQTGGFTVGTPTAYDVTGIVASQVATGSPDISFNIKSVGPDASSAYLRFASMENADSGAQPRLVITYTSSSRLSGIETVLSELDTDVGDISVYPVPAKNTLNVSLPSADDYVRLEVIDLTGSVLIEKTNLSVNKTVLDIERLSNGIYLLKALRKDNSIQTIRFVK